MEKKKIEIKQTKTSLLRLAKANPLLAGDESFLEIKRTLQNGPAKPQVVKKSKIQIPWNNCNKIEHESKRSTLTKEEIRLTSKQYKSNLSSKLNLVKTQSDQNFKVPLAKTQLPKIKHRRSLSAEHFERKKHLNKALPEKLLEKSEMTQSTENLQNESSILKPPKSVTFKTPEASKRGSYFSSTPSKLYHSTPSLPSIQDLQKRLNDWLLKRGKSLATFHHLKCFGRETPVYIDDENKENTEPESMVRSESYDNLLIESNAELEVVKVPVQIQYELIVKDALQDLEKLIRDGYPLDQCEAWLGSIRKKYNNIDEEPNYWECRAAVEQARGNLSSAVECFKTAIVKGAEVDEIDESLDHLLKKFSVLDIETPTHNNHKKERIIKEARNIFKSSIIQFAVQERNMKRSTDNKKFVVTPVRRSTRQSRSMFVSTPTVKLCDSLQSLDESYKERISFKNNIFL